MPNVKTELVAFFPVCHEVMIQRMFRWFERRSFVDVRALLEVLVTNLFSAKFNPSHLRMITSIKFAFV